MIDVKISSGLYDLETWIHDNDVHDKVYRVWFKNFNRKSDYDYYLYDECDYMFFTEFITLPDGDILIGMQSVDDDAENKKFDSIEYHKLSSIDFSYYESDNSDLWDDE